MDGLDVAVPNDQVLDEERSGRVDRGASLRVPPARRKEKNARFIPEITVEELMALDLDDLVVERSVLELMRNAQHRRSIQVINGLKPGNLTAALNGEHVGTVISA